MDLGIHYSNFSYPGWRNDLTDTLVSTARIADQGGVDLLTVMDHWFQMEVRGGPAEPMLEGYTTLGALSQVTSNVRLSMLVTGVTYRYPGLLAKIVTTLDVLSKGRAMLGIGAAWYDREHAGLGVPFPPLADRFERLEEAILVCRQMWSDDDGPFDGKHYQLKETANVPPPVRGTIPLLVGGGGERKTLRLVAQYADACHLFAREGLEGIKHKLEVLRRHCDDVGRDYDSIEKTVGGIGSADPGADPDTFLAQAEEFAKLGFTVFTTTPTGDDPVAWTERVCDDVVPRLKEL
ncbi:LLM class F420-dependent oxidoreductase [Nocardioides sp. KR10-350]|uniref:LLM class F420-dependent oxidoreductase n=1 Tax=Nocardioides cheoyonin TaxID=3156615 RepID=UPI0032B4D1F0